MEPDSSLPVAIASDHAGFFLKTYLQTQLSNFAWLDLGPNSNVSVDYPDYAQSLCHSIQKKECIQGVLICGSGIGMCIAANKFKGIRAALIENLLTARLCREHNASNVLCLGARILAPDYALEILKTWLQAKDPSQPQHQARLAKIMHFEKS